MKAKLFRLAELSTETLAKLATTGRPVVALVSTGSVEPHGPHLPLATDTIISEAVAERAAKILSAHVECVIAPPIPYGVTDYSRGFAGAVSIPAAALTAFARAVVDGLLASGISHVCLVNNHLEPAHDEALSSSLVGIDPHKASYACPLNRRWARTLSDEFKSGQCHAGRYETSIVLSAAPALVDEAARAELPEVPVSLSRMIKSGVTDFKAMGLDRAYAGSPGAASAEEGDTLIERLATMVSTSVLEHLGLAARSGA